MQKLWLAFSSQRTTALLAVALAGLTLASVFIPQGWMAVELARLPHSQQLQQYSMWGLTEILGSFWLKALGLVLLLNLGAVVLRLSRQRWSSGHELPQRVPHEQELSTVWPEQAAERLKDSFRYVFGRAPAHEAADGSQVTMVFDTGSGKAYSLLVHVGLVCLLVGTIWSTMPPPRNHALVRAILEVTDSRSRSTGVFDMAQDEAVQFFQWNADFTIRQYEPMYKGLGPAIRIEQVFKEKRQIDDFWVYLNAPRGFDARHRQGIVSIRALSMGLQPKPGAGMASRWAAVLLLLGVALLGLGTAVTGRPHGRVWIWADGDQIVLKGVPERAGDEGFAKSFQRWALFARSILNP